MPKLTKNTSASARLEDLPNIGISIAGDLRGLGIQSPAELATQDPLSIYLRLSTPMGKRHDPCVLYTLVAARHYLDTGEALAWWKFTEAGKRLLGVPVKARRG
jgi:Pathogenicity locus